MGYKFKVLFFLILGFGSIINADDRQYVHELIQDAVREKLADDSVVAKAEIANDIEVLRLVKLQDDIQRVELKNFALNNPKTQAEFFLRDGSKVLVDVTIEVSKEFASTARALRPGALLEENDLSVVNVSLNKFNLKDYLTKNEVVGLQAKRSLPAGILLKKQDLVSPIVVRGGDIVNVIYQSESLRLQSTAKALGHGVVGDTIRLKTMDNKNILVGKILDKDTVIINAKN